MPEARRILPDGTEEEYRREKLLEQLPFDPVPQPLPGTTEVYYVTAHSPWYAIASLALASIFLFLTWKSKKKGECR